ncbi:valine--tRNA ligase-like isoform X2 [Anthonomus grandis grandis]|uniref:valine--tRNA ligase-like isoform X2 n=1 Tax=Anthonomus grandis grandis TaxID=2921223 RepID=UPI0021664E5F|nr:valine--tRNA ligase-like isoform X2 [Anthonomus grandis grandis]
MLILSRHCVLCSHSSKFLSSYTARRKYFSENSVKNELAAAYKPHEIANSKSQDTYFCSKVASNEPPFSLILPPPNITGTLHLGHALTSTIQDVLVKWHKMKGRKTMWVPGLDHAGIATQVIVEKKLWKERGLTRHDLGRSEFEKEVLKWKNEKGLTIIQQLKCLNIDLNWDKETFTMDEKRSKAVTEAFIKLFEDGLIYRADHLVNWSCALQSAISDIEVEHIQVNGLTKLTVPGYDKPVQFGFLTKFAYKLTDSEEEVIVATTRPETMLGDVAVCVNPKDTRYSRSIGKMLYHPFRHERIPIIADEFVDPEFGTGAVKITPAHDPTDFEAAKRHNLKLIPVINEKGLLTNVCDEFTGIKRFDAREKILNRLAEVQLLRGTSDHSMTVPVCSRSKDVVEYLTKPQWFLSCSQMAERAVLDVREGKLQIEPAGFEKVWYQWLENIRDWCISRQLWWGHRIPAYSCHKKESMNEPVWVAAENESNAKAKASKLLKCDINHIECVQDQDVLDTWFSSGLQPFSVHGWPEKTEDLEKYYPLSLMETGHDILFFWVARMVMLGSHLTGQLPFKKILLHGIICDSHGRKMSKSLGNVVAPEDVIKGTTLEKMNEILKHNYKTGILSSEELKKALEGQKKMFPNGIPECGADALRYTLLSHNIKSHIINFDVNECRTNQLFGNKIWQATKFTLLWINKVREAQPPNKFEVNRFDYQEFGLMDRWVLSRLDHMLGTVQNAMDNFDFYIATAALKQFLYYEYCDIYLEAVKTDLKDKTIEEVAKVHCITLLTCLDKCLRALAPFMPALSQHLHKHLPNLWNIGCDRSFPQLLNLKNSELEAEVQEITDVITCIRRLKKIFNITFKYKPEAYLETLTVDRSQKFHQVIKDLAHLYTFNILDHKPTTNGLVKERVRENTVYVVVPEELRKNLEVDIGKMEQKKEKLLKELEKLNQMISAAAYREKASPETQQNATRKIAQLNEKIDRITYIQSLKQ